jgi:predicted kinase
MVVLVACPGAGKSFFSERLIRATVAHNAAAAAVQAAAAALDATLEATPPAAATVADQSASAAVSSDSPSTIEQPASKRPRTDDVPAFNVAAALDFVPAQSPPATNSTAPASGASAAPPSTSSSSASAHAAAASVSPTSPAAAAAAPAPPSATFLANARLALAPFVRINQDTLGSRHACELAADKALRDGFSVIIDRTNIDAAQRATWRKLAAKHSLVNVDAVILQVPVEVCKQRVMGRVGHETLSVIHAQHRAGPHWTANHYAQAASLIIACVCFLCVCV